jgi:hypothetical protein
MTEHLMARANLEFDLETHFNKNKRKSRNRIAASNIAEKVALKT